MSAERGYRYLASCVTWPPHRVHELEAMQARAREVKYDTFAGYVFEDHLARLSTRLGYGAGSRPLSLRDDYHVRYYSTRFRDAHAVYLVHSATEYVFVPSSVARSEPAFTYSGFNGIPSQPG